LKKKPPPKCCLVRILEDFPYGPHEIKKGDIGIFTAFVTTNVGEKEHEAIIVDFFYVYLPKLGFKITIPRSDFEIIKKDAAQNQKRTNG